MKLDEYKNTGDSAQQQTHVTFDNPDHPDVDVGDEQDQERARQWYKAAKSIQNSSIDRQALVGDILVAIEADRVDEFLREQSE